MQLLTWTMIYGGIAMLARWVSVIGVPQQISEVAAVLATIFLGLTVLGAAGLGYRAAGWWQELRLTRNRTMD